MRHPADSYTFEDGQTIRLLNEQILVRFDPIEEKTAGGIIKPEGACDHVYQTGTILAFGWMKDRPLPDTTKRKLLPKPIPIPDLEVGLKCCFIRFHRVSHSNQNFRGMFGDDMILLKPEDVLFLFLKGDEFELGQ